jgi:hypothetical protein
VLLNSRGFSAQISSGQGCSHKGYTAVVIVMSGAATLVVGGTRKAAAADKFQRAWSWFATKTDNLGSMQVLGGLKGLAPTPGER